MKNKLLFFLVFIFVSQVSISQTSKVVFHLGATANYYVSENYDNLSQTSFTNTRLSYGLNAAIGVISCAEDKSPKNTFAFFGTYGLISDDLAATYILDQGLSYSIDPLKNSSDFQELEFGTIIHQVFRISFGKGWLNFYDTAESFTTLQYYSVTSGLSIPIGSLVWSVNVTAMGGIDFNSYVYRPSTSLIIKLN